MLDILVDAHYLGDVVVEDRGLKSDRSPVATPKDRIFRGGPPEEKLSDGFARKI